MDDSVRHGCISPIQADSQTLAWEGREGLECEEREGVLKPS